MLHPRFKQWLYRGNRPNLLAQLLNRWWGWVASIGITRNYMETLEVIGRKSGRLVSFPVAIALVDGQQYLVSMLGNDAQWVHNVRAAHGQAALRSGRRREVRLDDVPVEQRAPILQAYIKRAPGARPHMLPLTVDSPLTDFERAADQFPVFRVVNVA